MKKKLFLGGLSIVVIVAFVVLRNPKNKIPSWGPIDLMHSSVNDGSARNPEPMMGGRIGSEISPHEIPASEVEEPTAMQPEPPPLPENTPPAPFAPDPPKFNDVNGDRPPRE
jgi:hypothetical protein